MEKNLFKGVWESLGVTPLIQINSLLGNDFQGKLFAKTESSNPTGLFTDRIANVFFKLLQEQNKLLDNRFLVDVFKQNFTLSFASKAVSKGFKLVVFYESGSDAKEIQQLSYLGCHLHECCSKREVLKEINDFKDQNVCLNISEEFNTAKASIKINLLQEIEEQLGEKIEALFISNEWREFLGGEQSKVRTISSINSGNPDLVLSHSSEEVLKAAQKYLQTQGVMLGKKSSYVLAGSLSMLKGAETKDKNYVVVFEDSSKYASIHFQSQVQRVTFNQDQIHAQGMKQKQIQEIIHLKEEPYYDKRMTVGDCFEILKKGKSCVPIREESRILGIVDCNSLRKNFLLQNLDKNNSCIKCIKQDFFELPIDSKMVQIEKALEENEYILLTEKEEDIIKKLYVVTTEDLLLILNDKMQLVL